MIIKRCIMFRELIAVCWELYILHNDGRKPELLNLKIRNWWPSCIVGCEGFSSMKRGVESSKTYLKI